MQSAGVLPANENGVRDQTRGVAEARIPKAEQRGADVEEVGLDVLHAGVGTTSPQKESRRRQAAKLARLDHQEARAIPRDR